MHDDITELKRDIGLDCGDHSCRYAVVRTGMRTNGGCRCEPPAKQIADLTRRLEEAQEDARRVRIERDHTYEHLLDIQAKLAAVEQERDTMRTALLAAKDALEGYAACCDGCTCGDGWGHEAAQAALLRLAQKMIK